MLFRNEYILMIGAKVYSEKTGEFSADVEDAYFTTDMDTAIAKAKELNFLREGFGLACCKVETIQVPVVLEVQS